MCDNENEVTKSRFHRPSRVIANPKGDLAVLWESTGAGDFCCEAYVSRLNHLAIKGLKKHIDMSMRLSVIYGHVAFFFYDDEFRIDHAVCLQPLDGSLIVPSGIWFAFADLGTNGPTGSAILNLPSCLTKMDRSITSDLPQSFHFDLENVKQ